MRLIGLLLAFCSIAQAAEPKVLGRLFHTPEERRALDQERDAAGNKGGREGGQLTVNGVIFRSSGDTTVWINQQMQDQGRDATLKPSGRIRAADGRTLRVGETADKNQIEDLLEPGAIRVIPHAP